MNSLQHTQQQVILSINVITQDDNGLHFAVLPVVSLSWLVMLFWQTQVMVSRSRFKLQVIIENITNRLSIAGKLATIGFNSLAWGLI